MKYNKLLFFIISCLMLNTVTIVTQYGKLHVILGPMCSNKTKRLIEEVKKAIKNRSSMLVMHHYHEPPHNFRLAGVNQETNIISRTGAHLNSLPVQEVRDLQHHIDEINPKHIFIDEAQLFDKEQLLQLVHILIARGIDITIAGVDLTCDYEPFGAMAELCVYADEITKLATARCHVCNKNSRCISTPSESYDIKTKRSFMTLQPHCRECKQQQESKTHE